MVFPSNMATLDVRFVYQMADLSCFSRKKSLPFGRTVKTSAGRFYGSRLVRFGQPMSNLPFQKHDVCQPWRIALNKRDDIKRYTHPEVGRT
jgi:hypothetical protein